MEVCFGVDNVVRNQKSVLTVGTFDGIHLGHQYVIGELASRAKHRNAISTLITFEPHPRSVIKKKPAQDDFKILTSIEEKLQLLNALNLDRVIVLKFTSGFAETNASDFIENVLHRKVGFEEIVVGYDHAFGKNREGGIETCRKVGAKLNFAVQELGEFKSDSQYLSSSIIRKNLKEGRIKEVNRALGRSYAVSGTVVAGSKRGRLLDFPTANLAIGPIEKMIPGTGVYAVEVNLNERLLHGMMNIGVRPTFDSKPILVPEVHLFDFSENIYGETLTVRFHDKIRDEAKFSSPEALRIQLVEDKKKSIDILLSNKQEA